MSSLARSYYNLFAKGVGIQVDWGRTAMAANDLRRFLVIRGKLISIGSFADLRPASFEG
jgi:hypothetical protein